jgi:hypothetical protein
MWGKNNSNDENFWDDLYDSIQLTQSILPDMLPLINVDDYKWKMMTLLGRMIDSNLVVASDYEMYFNKFFLEAKQEYKKQVIVEKQKLIKEASEKNLKADEDDNDTETNDYGNVKLQLYEKLLLPFWKTNASVPAFFKQLLETSDKKLKYNTMLLLIQNRKPVADSILNSFAVLDEYRYTFYNDLEECDQLGLFPKQYNNPVVLAKSKLISAKSYNKPDSVAYLDKLPAEFNFKHGFVYFFKYKEKKDDPIWRIATVGLLSADSTQFEIRDGSLSTDDDYNNDGTFDDYDLTSFTETRILENEPVSAQLNRQLKKLLYSHRKSAKEFYDVSKNNLDGFSSLRLRN